MPRSKKRNGKAKGAKAASLPSHCHKVPGEPIYGFRRSAVDHSGVRPGDVVFFRHLTWSSSWMSRWDDHESLNDVMLEVTTKNKSDVTVACGTTCSPQLQRASPIQLTLKQFNDGCPVKITTDKAADLKRYIGKNYLNGNSFLKHMTDKYGQKEAKRIQADRAKIEARMLANFRRTDAAKNIQRAVRERTARRTHAVTHIQRVARGRASRDERRRRTIEQADSARAAKDERRREKRRRAIEQADSARAAKDELRRKEDFHQERRERQADRTARERDELEGAATRMQRLRKSRKIRRQSLRESLQAESERLGVRKELFGRIQKSQTKLCRPDVDRSSCNSRHVDGLQVCRYDDRSDSCGPMSQREFNAKYFPDVRSSNDSSTGGRSFDRARADVAALPSSHHYKPEQSSNDEIRDAPDGPRVKVLTPVKDQVPTYVKTDGAPSVYSTTQDIEPVYKNLWDGKPRDGFLDATGNFIPNATRFCSAFNILAWLAPGDRKFTATDLQNIVASYATRLAELESVLECPEQGAIDLVENIEELAKTFETLPYVAHGNMEKNPKYKRFAARKFTTYFRSAGQHYDGPFAGTPDESSHFHDAQQQPEQPRATSYDRSSPVNGRKLTITRWNGPSMKHGKPVGDLVQQVCHLRKSEPRLLSAQIRELLTHDELGAATNADDFSVDEVKKIVRRNCLETKFVPRHASAKRFRDYTVALDGSTSRAKQLYDSNHRACRGQGTEADVMRCVHLRQKQDFCRQRLDAALRHRVTGGTVDEGSFMRDCQAHVRTA
uniref:Uncharacterized protein n=1 Tax=viral metagenome TaxID=1070528 RepID=A0A6C0KED9_9ZZZZ